MNDPSKMRVLSITKPRAVKEFECAWASIDAPHMIKKGNQYVRVVWQFVGEPINSDHICVDCWTAS